MASIRPVESGRTFLAGALLIASITGCGGRRPVLVPPEGGVEAVEGFASARIEGAEAAAKGKFAFVFRRPGLGRVEAVDPIGRTAFLIIFNGERACFVLPGKKAYAEDETKLMMERFLGVALLPDEAIELLSGTWTEAGPEGGWQVKPDEKGRAASGERGPFSFAVRDFFPGAAVPREIDLAGPETSGRVKVLRLGFNPPPRDEAFDVAFLRGYAPKTWDGIMELLAR
jgi:predicted small lipoprotein YifL